MDGPEQDGTPYSGGAGGPGGSGGSFDRVPPQDIAAEQSVLGGMLLSKDAIADVVEVLRGPDYYRPAHETVHNAVLDLYARGEPADPITTAAELTKRGEINRVGGASYLHTLVSSVPTAANAEYYAEIVREQAVLRRLVEAGTRIAQMGYAADGDVDEIVNNAQSEIYAVTEQRTTEDYAPLAEIMEGALDEIEAIGSRSGEMNGVPSGFTDFDSLTNGLHPGQMIVVAARPAMGKCLAASTRLTEAHSGEHLSIAEFVRRGRAGEHLTIHTLGADQAFHPVRPSAFHDNGVQPVHRLTTGLGHTVRATATHPFLTEHGWAPLEQLAAGDPIALAPTALTASDLPQDGTTAGDSDTTSVRWDAVASIQPDGADTVYDLTVDGTHNFVAEGIVVHNSTLALDFARTASIHNAMPSVIFSLEMGRNEIAMRLLSAEARVALHHMRSGNMTDDDWTRVARCMAEINEAPLYIDDSPNLTMMEIRAKCRRLKQRNDLRVVVIDYLQLMQTGGSRRPESRQQEVSDMSRSLKLLAKELEVPVIALSQLNRGPEQRTDKKPMISDLRESGCMTADTTLLRADTGAPITFAELMEHGHEGVVLWSLDEQRRIVRAPVTNVFFSGVKPVHRLRLASGREVKATATHPFLTFDGWTPLGSLDVGSRIAIPRVTREPIGAGLGWSDHRIGLLAHLIGDGRVSRKQPVHYTSNNEANLEFVEAAARAEFGITPRRVRQGTGWHSYLPAPYGCTHGESFSLSVWFAELGIEDLRSCEKCVPEVLYSATNDEVATFLRHLWATDGSVWLPGPGEKHTPRISYSTTSRLLADGVTRLLSRFGIVARTVKFTEQGEENPRYQVDVSGGPDTRAFCQHIGVHGWRGENRTLLTEERDKRKPNTNVGTPPREAWHPVRAEHMRAGLTTRQFHTAIGANHCSTTMHKSRASRDRMKRCADVLDSATPRTIASDDVFWDQVVEIEPLGEQPVYDATVKGTHNFIADGIAAHNSIEQDSDMVILLHREDAYEKESPRAGEADLIVAKHRNGPTATISVAFQGHYSRFVDMTGGGM